MNGLSSCFPGFFFRFIFSPIHSLLNSSLTVGGVLSTFLVGGRPLFLLTDPPDAVFASPATVDGFPIAGARLNLHFVPALDDPHS